LEKGKPARPGFRGKKGEKYGPSQGGKAGGSFIFFARYETSKDTVCDGGRKALNREGGSLLRTLRSSFPKGEGGGNAEATCWGGEEGGGGKQGEHPCNWWEKGRGEKVFSCISTFFVKPERITEQEKKG